MVQSTVYLPKYSLPTRSARVVRPFRSAASFLAASITELPSNGVHRLAVVMPAMTSVSVAQVMSIWTDASRPEYLAQYLTGHGMNALAQFGPAVLEFDAIGGRDFHAGLAHLGYAVSDAAVLDGAGQARKPGRIKPFPYRIQAVTQTHPRPQHMAGRGHPTGSQGVVVPELPAVETALGAQFVDQAFHSEGRLVYAESPKCPGGRIIRIIGTRHDVHTGEMIGPAGMSAGPGNHLAAYRCVSTAVTDDPCPERRELALPVARQLVAHPHTVPLRMHADRLRPAEPHLDRPPEEQGEKRGMMLDAQVFFASEAAARGTWITWTRSSGRPSTDAICSRSLKIP